MKKTFIRMNNNEQNLSLGNLCRIIKELANNKEFAGQSEIFYALFEDENISDSAINNYCIGYREIGKKYKNIYFDYQKKYTQNKNILQPIIINIIMILEGIFDSDIQYIDNNSKLKKLCLSLYNISKNDESVANTFSEKIYHLIEENHLQEALSEILFFIILEKKQPIYTDKINRETLESLLNNTNISINELEKFLKLQLNDGVNYFYSIKTLAKEENSYACFELGEMEYKGEICGEPRYIKSYEYLKIAANKNHPRANWLIAQMFLHKQLGNHTEKDFEIAWSYLQKAKELGSIAAINTMGIFYLNGYVPNHPKDEQKAIEYFKNAANFDYAYAYNNLGKIYEEKNDLKQAIYYYSKSADLEESWACNKIAEFYRKGLYFEQNDEKAFHYYTLALNVPSFTLEYWSMYNLAKYFYRKGNYYIHLEADEEKAMELLEHAFKHKIYPAYEELIMIYIDKIKRDRKEEYVNKINQCVKALSTTSYYPQCRKNIEKSLNSINDYIYITLKK